MEKNPLSIRIGQALRRYFVAGLATLFPATVTVYLLVSIFQFTDGLIGRHLAVHIPGLGLLLTVLILLLVGFLATHFLGRVVFPTVELWFARLPLVRQIYPAIKQLTQFLFGAEGRPPSFQRVVLVEYPRSGLYSLAFVTHKKESTVTGTPVMMFTLLIPTPPSPLTGPLVIAPEKEIIPLTMSIEEALKLIVSGGVVSPSLEAAKPGP